MGIYVKKSLIIGVVVTIILLLVPVKTIPQAPDAAQHEFPSAETFGLKEYGFPFTMYWKFDYASLTDLLTEKDAITRGGEIHWWAIGVNFLFYTLIVFVILRFSYKTRRRS